MVLYFLPKVRYEDGKKFRIPKGSLIVSNHNAALDGVFLMCLFIFRDIRFVVSRTMYNKTKFLHFSLWAMSAIVTDRYSVDNLLPDRIRYELNHNRTVVIFPEGKFPDPGQTSFGEFHPLYVSAVHNQFPPVVPIYLDGNYGLFKRSGIVFGKPRYLANSIVTPEIMREESETIKASIQSFRSLL